MHVTWCFLVAVTWTLVIDTSGGGGGVTTVVWFGAIGFVEVDPSAEALTTIDTGVVRLFRVSPWNEATPVLAMT
jgi:hypothetical protein